MNQYAAIARAHYRTHLPNRLARIEEPEEFFSQAGETIAQQVDQEATDLAGDDPAEETYPEKVARLNTARMMAEDTVLHESLYDLKDLPNAR